MKLQTLNFIILTSAVVVFIGAGCKIVNRNQVAASNTNTEISLVQEEKVNGSETQGLEEGDADREKLDEESEEENRGDSEEIDTSDWLTYENEEYGFSFRYPKDWNLKELEEGGLGTDQGDIIINNNSCNIYIPIPHEKDDQITAVKKYDEALSSGNFGTEPIKKVQLGSIQAIQYLNPKFAYERKGEVYLFVINRKIFSYSLGYANGNENCITFSNNILLTFKINS